jgi:L-ribulose-5-phosphate 4-epimerase
MLENLKIKVVKMAKDAEKNNLCKGNIGSFSIRDESSGYVVITPSKIAVENLNVEHVCVVDLKGNKINVADGTEPTSDISMHLEVYRARKDIKTIMHIHSVHVSTFAVINKVIPPIAYDSANYGGYIYVANGGNAESSETTKDLVEKLNMSDACLLESNGAIVVSGNIENILFKAITVERVAEIYYKALVLNQSNEPKRFSREELALYSGNR